MANKDAQRVNLYWTNPTTRDKLRAVAKATNHRSISAVSEHIIHEYIKEHPELLRDLIGE